MFEVWAVIHRFPLRSNEPHLQSRATPADSNTWAPTKGPGRTYNLEHMGANESESRPGLCGRVGHGVREPQPRRATVCNLEHMGAAEETLPHGLVPVNSCGRFGPRTQEWSGCWLNYLTGEWGYEKPPAPPPAPPVAAHSTLPR